MTDFAALRRAMVDGQVRTADVTDLPLIAAMLELPRERFVPEDKASLAYLDLDVAVSAPGQPVRRLLKPMVLAKMVQAAGISETSRVLDVGCATGYSTALLAMLAGPVTGLDEDATLTRQAADALSRAGLSNGVIVTGPLINGHAAAAPYDVILLQGSSEVPPAALLEQLAEGGRLVGVIGQGPAAKATIYRRVDGELSSRPIFDASAAPLPGFIKPPAFVF